ncbi:MAG: hypothetical protein M5U09_18225 [Gammaproteobacteria bacterium]|nr:hypothetical protein [Gammaproteobacteria bacterium]
MSAWFDDRYGRIASAIVWFLVAAAVLLWRAAAGADTIDGLDDAGQGAAGLPRRLPELSTPGSVSRCSTTSATAR